MHEYRRFIQQQLDSRRWKQADLARHSGLNRQLISNIVNDKRSHLGQMPENSTLEGIAKAFGIPVERVRIAAARSLAGYTDDGAALTLRLQDVHIDVLLNEIRRRVEQARPVEVDGQSGGLDGPKEPPFLLGPDGDGSAGEDRPHQAE